MILGFCELLQILINCVCEMLKQEGLFRHDFIWSPYFLRVVTTQESSPIVSSYPRASLSQAGSLLPAGSSLTPVSPQVSISSTTIDNTWPGHFSKLSYFARSRLESELPKNAELWECVLQTKKFSLRIKNIKTEQGKTLPSINIQ